jgi:CubicO group peptidase (beta-lactamase class C family)
LARSSCLLLGALFLAARAIPARAAAPEPFRGAEKLIEAQLAKGGVPSVAVAVSKDGKVLWQAAFGLADVEKRRPATPDTMYCVGSVSKPITATGLMVLAERGDLSLDDPANKHLGDSKLQSRVGDAAGATLRRLADHSSGLARHDLYPDGRHAPLAIGERIRRYGWLLREPGESYEYSNLGYMALSHVIERRSGRPFGAFLRDEVFLPLGMANSAVGIDPKRPGAAAVSYGADGKPRKPPAGPEEPAGHGGIYASANDLLRFGVSHLKQPIPGAKGILSAKSLEQMHRRSSRAGPLSWYGIGWRVEQVEFGSPAVMHTGQTDGATACLVLIPEHRLCVAAACNAPHALPWHVTQEVIKRLVPKGPKAPKPEGGHERFGRQDYKPTKEWLGRWSGVVKTHEREVPIEVRLGEDGKVRVQLKGQGEATAGGVRVEDGYLRGSLDGDLGTADLAGEKYRLHFKLIRRGEGMSGSITASSMPGGRVITLSHWVDLRRLP